VSYPLVSRQAMPYLGLSKSGLTAKHQATYPLLTVRLEPEAIINTNVHLRSDIVVRGTYVLEVVVRRSQNT
jgi:hypothetical protein